MKHIIRKSSSIIALVLLFLTIQTRADSCTESLCCLMSRINRILVQLTVIRELIEEGDCTPTFITQADVPYVIGLPGLYIMSEDIVYNPAAAVPAITINADHVVLDLCSNTLSQALTNTIAAVDGISVTGGTADVKRHDIEIRNGTVESFTRVGIAVNDNTDALYIHDIITKYMGARTPGGIPVVTDTVAGIFLEGGAGITNTLIKDVQSYGNASAGSAAAGILMASVENIKIENVICNDNRSSIASIKAANGFGIAVFGGTNIECINCTTDHNQGNSVAAGIFILESANVAVSGCTSNDNFVSAAGVATSEAVGYGFVRVTGITIKNCTSAGVRNLRPALVGTDLSGASGILLSATEQALLQSNSVYDVSSALDHSVGYLIIADISGGEAPVESRDVVVQDCQALHIVNSNVLNSVSGYVGLAAGFSTARSDNTADNSLQTFDIVFKECIADDIEAGLSTATLPNGSKADGFLIFNSQFAVLENSIAKNAHNFPNNLSATASGIGIETNATAPLQTKDLIKGNIAHNNARYGITNNQVNAIHNAFAGNYAYHNGATTAGSNYFDFGTSLATLGTSAGIIVWPLDSGPAPLTCKHPELDNFDIRQTVGATGLPFPICPGIA